MTRDRESEVVIFRDRDLFVEIHDSALPWVKLFTQEPFKELSLVPKESRYKLFDFLDTIEKEMIAFFKPDKINIASFGNYLPHLHFYITARFRNDSHFPEPLWGKRQRENSYAPSKSDLESFYTQLSKKLSEI